MERLRLLWIALGMGLLLPLSLAPVAVAQLDDLPEVDESMRDTGETGGLFQVVRIELALFGGVVGGDSFLELPDILDEEQTFDTGAAQIVDFNNVPRQDLRAPLKYIQDGRMIGGTASFYLGTNFGMQLTGSWATAEAVLTGHSAENKNRFVADRSDMDLITVGGNIIYNLGKERKWRGMRPFVNLGFGGILNKFPGVDDVGAVYFNYGGGLSYPVWNQFRLEAMAHWRLYTWDTDEIARDETVQLPTVSFGIAWRHDVPPPEAPATESSEEEAAGTGR